MEGTGVGVGEGGRRRNQHWRTYGGCLSGSEENAAAPFGYGYHYILATADFVAKTSSITAILNLSSKYVMSLLPKS